MAIDIHRLEAFEVRLALEELNNNFCYYLDHSMTEELVNLFTEDAVYVHGSRQSHGRQEILQVFEKRGSRGARTARHLQTGLRIQMESEDRARGESVCMTFAENALPPVNHASPYLIADFIDRYRRCDDGEWRIAARTIERIFVAPENTGPVGQS